MRHLSILCLLLLLVVSTPASAFDAPKLFEDAVASVVKISVSGITATDQPKTIEGSGTVLFSANRLTVIATAAHVVGTSDFWKAIPGDQFDRTVTVRFVDPSTNRLGQPITARVHQQDDNQDWAILVLPGGKDPALPRGSAILLPQGSHILLMGYKEGEEQAESDEGSAAAAEPAKLGFVLRLGELDVLPGMSGGPVLNEAGEIVGIASADLLDEPGYHYAVPISLVKSVLAEISDNAETISAQTMDNISFSAITVGEVSGSGGGALAGSHRLEGKINVPVVLDLAGGEASECDAGSGRTISRGLVDAKATVSGTDTLAIDIRVLVQGGHYRTAGACIRDPFSGDRKLVGITGHDTSTHVGYHVQGTIAVPVDPLLSDKVTVAWAGMPDGARLTATAPNGAVVLDAIATAGDGSVDLPVTERGTIVLQPTVAAGFDRDGSCCAIDQRIAGSISVARHFPET